MTIATITSKGQVTIPKSIRERLHLQPGDQLDFLMEGEESVRIKRRTKHPDEVFGLLGKCPRRVAHIEDIDEALRQAFKKGNS